VPTYKPPRSGVQLSEALHEAAAVAPIARAMLDTLELFHPVGTPDGPIYVVNDPADFPAFKEAGAARDDGVEVLFMRAAMRVERAEQSDQHVTPTLRIVVPNVAGAAGEALRAARGSLDPWELIHRVYASDDAGAPAILPPLVLYVESFEVSSEAVTLVASFGDSVNVNVPRLTFNRNEYPGLIR